METITAQTVAEKDSKNLVYSVDDAVNKAGYGIFQIKLTFLAGLGWLADAFEIFILSVIGDFMACDWILYRWQIAVLTSIVFAGIMVGSPVLGAVADIYGRKVLPDCIDGAAVCVRNGECCFTFLHLDGGVAHMHGLLIGRHSTGCDIK
ncbi:synaptic vesicle 2-related protein [Caerostris extrusa]|uniref:Synaptic vesicle 2-related protein n=1 Tax=Caerostris extrusa TaxID=172846 RepID=A0AAV4S6X6_CAEEX|nr:synaptic vesicle 2-related protein [Caerostris extrusa]